MMLRKCVGCLSKLGSRLFGESMARWQQHLDSYCRSNCQKYVWCDMLLDNFDIIRSFAPLSKQLEFEIKNTNISSEIVKIITRHYQEDENLFRFCIELFGSYLKLKFAEIINPSKATFTKLTKDYQQFLTLLKDLMVIYYKLQDREILGKDLFYKQTLPCLIVSFLFENQDISKTVHHIIRQVYKQSLEQIQFNIQKYSAYTIDEFGISSNLCLNKRTLDMFQAGGNIMSERPYQGAIQIIKEIVRVTSPSEKLHLIQGLQKQIESTVLGFYKHYGIRVDGVEIDYTSMKAIMLYILVQANQNNLYSHLQLVNHFSPKKSNKNNDSVLEIIISVLEALEKRHYSNSQLEESDFGMQSMEGKNYFDEVSSFQL